MTLDTRATQAVRALEAATADADPGAALDRVRRAQRRAVPFQLAAAGMLVLVLLAGALLLGRGRPAPPADRPPALVHTTAPPTTDVSHLGGHPIPPGPPFPRAAADAFPPPFDDAAMRDLRRRSKHPLAFPTRLPTRLTWRLGPSQVLDDLTDYWLRPAGSTLEVEIFHGTVDDGRSPDPMETPVQGLTLSNGLKVYPYQDMIAYGTEAYIISDRHDYVVVYFHGCGPDPAARPGGCLTRTERRQLVAGLALLDRGR